MHESDFWTRYADSVEMSVEGNRLIAQEIADGAVKLWRMIVRTFAGRLVRVAGQHRHLPPV